MYRFSSPSSSPPSLNWPWCELCRSTTYASPVLSKARMMWLRRHYQLLRVVERHEPISWMEASCDNRGIKSNGCMLVRWIGGRFQVPYDDVPVFWSCKDESRITRPTAYVSNSNKAVGNTYSTAVTPFTCPSCHRTMARVSRSHMTPVLSGRLAARSFPDGSKWAKDTPEASDVWIADGWVMVNRPGWVRQAILVFWLYSKDVLTQEWLVHFWLLWFSLFYARLNEASEHSWHGKSGAVGALGKGQHGRLDTADWMGQVGCGIGWTWWHGRNK